MSSDDRRFALVTYKKTGLLRYLGHLDLAKVFDRAVRRAGIAVKYTEGFSPRAYISFPSPLAVGIEGLAEMCAIELTQDADAREVYDALAPEMSKLTLRGVEIHPGTPKQYWAKVQYASYEGTANFGEDVSPAQLKAAAETLLHSDSVIIVRETKRQTRDVNIRPNIHRLTTDGMVISVCMGVSEDTLVKPIEVLNALGQLMGVKALGWHHLIRTGMHRSLCESGMQ